MLQANVQLIEELKGFVAYVFNNKSILHQFTHSASDFSRRRKLCFSQLVLFIIRLCKKTLSVEIEKFFDQMHSTTTCSVSAFTQQRFKLKASFFYAWNLVLCLNFYHIFQHKIRRWRGYRVIAVDGSSVSLVNTETLRSYFGGQTNQHTFFIGARTFYLYDVLNELVVHSEIRPYRSAELNMACKAMEYLSEDTLAIYDRNFCNYKMVALHLWQERPLKFVIRAKESLHIIKSFIKSGKSSSVESLLPGNAAIKGLRNSGFIITNDTALKVRLVRVDLDGTVEVLMTNLWEHEGYKACQFKDIYFMRWGIETAIALQKNVLQMESFSGFTVHAVMQDFYATVFMANLHSILIKNAQQNVDQQVHRKYPLKINKNKSFAQLRNHLVALF